MSAAPIGAPGCPDFARSTASTARNLIVLTHSCSMSTEMAGIHVLRWTGAAFSDANSRQRCIIIGFTIHSHGQGSDRMTDGMPYRTRRDGLALALLAIL